MIGQGTDLVVPLAPAHVWCVASLRQPDGRSFVPNLPTEEIFTAPRADGAAGVVRVARPVAYGGGLIVGAELEFQKGRVVRARAQAGEELLQRVLTTDDGAARLGEVALVPRPRPALLRDGVCFQQTLLDENALPHIALGEAYPFCVGRAGSGTINHSLVHLDLPIEAEVRVE
jgi:aminopeptidase